MDARESLKIALKTTADRIGLLAEMGIESVADLLQYFPRSHADFSDVAAISEIRAGESATVAGRLSFIKMNRISGGRWLIRGQLVAAEDAPRFEAEPDAAHGTLLDFAPRAEPASLDLVWFNQPYVARALKSGDEIVVTGKVSRLGRRHQMLVSSFENFSGELRHTGRLIPIYRSHGKVSSKWLREKIFDLLRHADAAPELLPDSILRQFQFPARGAAIRQMHFPDSPESLKIARQRLAFEELFVLQLSALTRKLDWSIAAAGRAPAIHATEKLRAEFAAALPFRFTRAQELAAEEICHDLAKSTPMNRLLEGDVGSGKTAVAALAIFLAARAGQQAALLAPTEILAQQHFRSVLKLLHPLGIRAELLTGSTTEKSKTEITGRLGAGQLDLIVGTHALLEERVQFQKLGLAVIDEQHRFGVEQRLALQKGSSPHVLNMTATPIPRTLALAIFGDQDVSIIDELPPGRQEILTRIVPAEKRLDAYRWMDDQIGQGRQVFVVCPLVDESDASGAKSAKAEFDRLQKTDFQHRRIGLLHGKMKPKEKEAVMADFSAGALDILVSTSVIEVGIDVPNATIMLIEGAERFGLAQLHQFRGRVGRGQYKSYCFLFPSEDGFEELERLQALEKVKDGFELAEIDLRLRGPGEFFGTRQSGLPDLKVANLSDQNLLRATRELAEEMLANDPQLSQQPELQRAVEKVNRRFVESRAD